MPQMNLHSFAVLVTKIRNSLPEGHPEREGLYRVLVELAKMDVSTVPRELGMLYARTDSSREAAEKIQAYKGEMYDQIIDCLVACGKEGATDAEMQIECGMKQKTQNPRRLELQLAGHVVQTGEKRDNPIRTDPNDTTKIITGLPAMVWVLTNFYDPLGHHSYDEIQKRENAALEKRLAAEKAKKDESNT